MVAASVKAEDCCSGEFKKPNGDPVGEDDDEARDLSKGEESDFASFATSPLLLCVLSSSLEALLLCRWCSIG